MVTPKKIIIKDLELADEEIARLRKENKELKAENKELKAYKSLYILLKERRDRQKGIQNRLLKEKLWEIKKAYIEFEEVETEYNNKLAVLDKLIMNR